MNYFMIDHMNILQKNSFCNPRDYTKAKQFSPSKDSDETTKFFLSRDFQNIKREMIDLEY